MAGNNDADGYTIKREGWIESVSVRRTTDSSYPSGWKCSYHFGNDDQAWVRRLDNSHEDTKDHELHIHELDYALPIRFTSVVDLHLRWEQAIDEKRPDDWEAPPSDFDLNSNDDRRDTI